ncbi:MBL fold metallo-hydrolase [Bacillus methanolicus]|uniref:Zn-dependent hydrolase n=1 Tax=Bacillus methanolicus (strain MGA3 / ATCC 53907) TaxID=796606 RepID=I3E952_BACMM|nr:MBL fold metallo-hydrolase [Bacillus methanolicus]AIE60278.1 Zn-dependent hydrolase [Bacillus methanolicus MGA3]EIJ83023.1 beta-lactamase domain protein [Bacillus methanolicus MGA3]
MLEKNNIKMLELTMNSMGEANVIYPTLIWDEENMILVDTGFPGQLNDIRECIEKAGVSFEKLNKIFITHQDIDHIGSLPIILDESQNKIDVYASAIEKPFIQGEKMILKITPEAISKALESLPPEIPEDFRNAFKFRLENPPKAKVDHVISGGEELPFCGGIIVIDTPGHTPGHLSFYHKASKTLIAGDALIVKNRKLYPSDPKYTLDIEKSIKSIELLSTFEIEKIICYHGGLFDDNVHERLLEIIKH